MPKRSPPRLDAIDQKLLDLIQDDAARSLYALGDAVGLSPSAVQRRLTRYRNSGLVTRHAAILDPEALPGTVIACVLVTLERETKRLHTGFQDRMRATPEVQQCYGLAGQWDYLVIVVANGMPHCRELIDALFLGVSNIQRYDTLFVFDVVKTGLRIPLRGAR